MTYKIINKTEQKVDVRVTVPVEELHKAAREAAVKLAKNIKINGFRPGKAPYEVIKQQLGEMKILEEAAGKLTADCLIEIIAKEKLDIIGQLRVDLEKLAPGNEFTFKAMFSLFPSITWPDFSKIKIEKREVKVEQVQIVDALEELRKMRVKEVLERRPAGKGDKVEVDYEVYVDEKLINGGRAEKQNVVIGEGQMIPGFEDQMIDLQANQAKEFEIEFPKNYTEELAGKKVKFKVKVRGVYKRELPELNDEFAKGLGKNNIDELRQQIEDNLRIEAAKREQERQELELLETITKESTFNFIPEDLVDNEQDQMLAEFKNRLEQIGGKFDDYLKHIKKSEDELKQSFASEAEKRLKLRLIFRKLIIDNKIEVDDKEVAEEIERQAKVYASYPEMVEKIKSEAYEVHIKELMLNRKVVEWLKNQVTRVTYNT